MTGLDASSLKFLRPIMKLNPLTAAVLLSLALVACGKQTPESYLAAARAALAKNDDKTAIIEAKNALQLDPNSGEGRYLLGSVFFDSDDFGSAEVELRKAQSLKYTPDLVVPKLALVLLGEGQFKKIVDEFAGVTLGAAKSAASLQTSLAYAQSMLGNTAASQAALQSALSAAPDFIPALIMQVRLDGGQGNFDAALSRLDSILQMDPKSVDAWQLKGEMLDATARPDEALAAYEKALAVRPNYQRAHLAIVSILLRQRKISEAEKQVALLRKTGSDTAQVAYFDALINSLQGNLQKAREQTLQLLKVAPDSPIVLSLAGSLELQRGSSLQAQRYLEQAVQLSPGSLGARRLLMTAYLRSNQSDKALAVMRQVASDGNVPPELYTVTAEAYLQSGDAKTAEDFFARAAKLDPTDASKKTLLAVARLSKGGEEAAAFNELQTIASGDKGTSADMALISAYMKRGDSAKALGAIDVLARKQPDQPIAAYLRGRVQLSMNVPGEARKSFELALSIGPTYYPAIAGLAALDIQEGNLDQAKKRLQDALAKDPKNVQALTTLAQLAWNSGSGTEEAAGLLSKAIAADPSDSAPRLYLINLYLSKNDLRQATSAAQNAVAALPDRTELVDALGRVQLKSGDYNQAIASFNRLIDLQPESPVPFLRLADANMVAKNRGAAIENLRKALQIKPDYLEAQTNLVTLYSVSGEFAEASMIARTVQQQRPASAVGYVLQGDILAGQREWDKAALIYQAGLKQSPNTELAVKLDTAYMASGREADAKRLQASWRKAHPADAAFAFHLGDTLMANKDYVSAEHAYLEVLKIQPKSPAALNNLAWITSQQKKEGALAYAEQANKLAPNQPAFMDTLAAILGEAKQFDAAIELQKRAIALQPSNPDLKFSLAKLYLKAGDKSNARQELNRLASLGSKFSAQAEVASMLGSL